MYILLAIAGVLTGDALPSVECHTNGLPSRENVIASADILHQARDVTGIDRPRSWMLQLKSRLTFQGRQESGKSGRNVIISLAASLMASMLHRHTHRTGRQHHHVVVQIGHDPEFVGIERLLDEVDRTRLHGVERKVRCRSV